MKKPTLNELKSQSDEIFENYRARFAGQPRATRDVNELRNLMAKLSGLIEEAKVLMNGGRNPAVLSLVETAQENLNRYREEESAIVMAQANPYSVEGARLASAANRAFDCYARHFAGQNRATRDPRLLQELVGELKTIRTSMVIVADKGIDATKQDLQTVDKQMELYEQEIAQIERARQEGTEEERASRLAQVANSQFALYNAHFAGKRRATRRPELIQRMLANLEDILKDMESLDKNGLVSESNRNNMGIVRQNLDMYRTELVEVRKAREGASLEDLSGMLGGAANDAMALYREHFAGKDRKSRDIGILMTICDELRYIGMQMDAIARTIDVEFNEKNLDIVNEARHLYEAEYKEVLAAQKVA